MRLLLIAALLAGAIGATRAQGASSGAASSAGAAAPDPSEYAGAIGELADALEKSTKQTRKLNDDQMAFVTNDPGDLITKELMADMVKSNSFLPQKAGSKSINLQVDSGFNGLMYYNPSGFKVSETMSGPPVKRQQATNNKEPVFKYPSGLGNVLLNYCMEKNYSIFSPCHDSKQHSVFSVCNDMMDSARFLGVGFDGRGYYSSKSRKVSLIQRNCRNKAMFLGKEVPDIMEAFGIYDYTSETQSFQSVDQYMRYVREKAGVSEQKGVFTSEASKFSSGNSFGANLGGILSAVGTGVGAAFGGPAGASMGAQLGGAIGGGIGGGDASGSGSSSQTDTSESSSSYEQTDESSTEQGSTQNFFAMMFVNIILYEITLDELKPTDLSLSFLKDYLDLPVSYFSVGSEVKFQNFLLRYGTHYVRSGKFGGQFKVIKTMKTTQSMTSQEFARLSETEFESMTSTLNSRLSQGTNSWEFLGFGEKKQNSEQSSSAQTETESVSTSNQENSVSQDSSESKYTHTNVEAQGGRPEIAEAIFNFYTPGFKQLFDDWIASIPDYPKPFEFQLRGISDIFNMRMDDLFPAGEKNYGCLGGNENIMVEAGTDRRFYIDTKVTYNGNTTIEEKIKVYCKYSNVNDFMKDLDRKRISLERAVNVYMQEGPFPTSSYKLPAGEVGCEEETLAALQAATEESDPPSFLDLKSAPFLMTFDMPHSIDGVVSKTAKFRVIYRTGTWYSSDPQASYMHLYDGCELRDTSGTDICFRNIILSYDEENGLFYVKETNFKYSKHRMPYLPNWVSGSTIARASRLKTLDDTRSSYQSDQVFIPCNVKWINSHRLDPTKEENCLHFSAATAGDIFVIFAAIPRNHYTWIYLQINPEGISFYKGFQLENRVKRPGMGVLGNANLFQSFFVCVVQRDQYVTMQYGKADPESEVGTVYSSYRFSHIDDVNRLSFYAFGSGEMSASFGDIRLTRKLPSEVECLNGDFIAVDGMCILDCHPECDGCKRARNNAACQKCKNKRVELGTGISKVTECYAECQPGYFPSQTSEGLCVPCAAGLYKNDTGNHDCSECPVGTFSSAGASQCELCAKGTYSNNKGQPTCSSCPAGKFSNVTGATGCEPCAQGHFSVAGLAQCDPCPAGYYAGTTETATCSPCAMGTYAENEGQISCVNCAKGSVAPEPAAKTCIKCQPGSVTESEGSATCKVCPAGTFSRESECVACSPGYYSDETNLAECKQCPPGTFTGSSGSISCSPCPSGTFETNWGASECQPCPGDLSISTATACYRYEFKGCYVDNDDRDIQGNYEARDDNNNRDCARYCFNLGFRVAGTQYHSHCFCGNSYGKYGTGTGCNTICAGSTQPGFEYMGDICGGPWRNTVFEIVQVES